MFRRFIANVNSVLPTLPPSTKLATITILLALYCQIILQKSRMVPLKGPKKIYLDCLLRKLKISIGKTKLVVSEKNCDDIERIGKWPCAVCDDDDDD